jgi:hypothetical protein
MDPDLEHRQGRLHHFQWVVAFPVAQFGSVPS